MVLVGDPYQLQAVGRGGMFSELCHTTPVHQLTTIHRFSNEWEAAASLQLRHGDPTVFDTYQHHDRITPGSIVTHLDCLTERWHAAHSEGRTVAITAATNDHDDLINTTIQTSRLEHGELDRRRSVPIAGGEKVCPGDVIVTRRNDRNLTTNTGEPVRNRETWTVDESSADGSR